MSKLIFHTFDHIEDAITDNVDEALNLKLRNQLMDIILEQVGEKEWTQDDVALCCGLTKPRAVDLLLNKISRFSLNDLVAIAASLEIKSLSIRRNE